jgi:hypothetical protein
VNLFQIGVVSLIALFVAVIGLVTGEERQAAATNQGQTLTLESLLKQRENTIYFSLPKILFKDLSILGTPIATKKQCIAYLYKTNSFPLIATSVEKLVDIYYQEGLKEGVRPDLAFAQALLETGHFSFGGDVYPHQNNYAGIGATGNKVKGAAFPTPEIGVRSQIQHLLGYASERRPREKIVDPRYELLAKIPSKHGKIQTWMGLGGNWAVPGVNYGINILKIHSRILIMPSRDD